LHVIWKKDMEVTTEHTEKAKKSIGLNPSVCSVYSVVKNLDRLSSKSGRKEVTTEYTEEENNKRMELTFL
jgi:hypothetical protein